MGTEYRFAEIRKLSEDVDKTRTVEFVISNEAVDRHNTVIEAKGWRLDNYLRNPVVGYQHNLYGGIFEKPDPDDVIGRSEVFIEGSQLIGRVTFEPPELNPLAEKIFQKIKFGTLRSASVGFIPKKVIKNKNEDFERITEAELMEWSIVNIPSNSQATKREISEQFERSLSQITEMLGNGLTTDEVRKMSLDAIIKMASGETRQTEQQEEKESQEVDNSLFLQSFKLRAQLKLHEDFEAKLTRAEKNENNEIEKQRRERAVLLSKVGKNLTNQDNE
jgi:hypothetical protein